MIFLAALQCLLLRHSGDGDIGVATCAANRSSTECETLIGPLSNRVLLRTDLSGNPTWREILTRVRNTALAAYSNQDVPFGTIVERFGRQPDASRNPLFQTLVVFENAAKEPWSLGDLKTSPFSLDTGSTRYDLNVWLRLTPADEVEIDFQYNVALFSVSSIRNLLLDYCRILNSFVENPGEHPKNESSRSPAPLCSAPKTQPSTSPLLAVQDAIEKRLQKMWGSVLELSSVDSSTDFFALGGDSLRAARLFALIEKVFGVTLPVSTILEARTIHDVARILQRTSSRPRASSLVAVKPSGAQPPVFCIHNHTGDVLFCRDLPTYINPDQPIYGLQSRFLADQSPHFSVESMAAEYVTILDHIQPLGPCLLFGYSFGGLVAFQMAQILHERGRSIAFLGMFNTPAPGSLSGWPLRQFSYLHHRTRNELAKLASLGSK